MTATQRMTELGLHMPEVARPVASYIPSTVSGNLVFTAGQLPFVEGKLPATGKVGSDIDPVDAAVMAQTALLNALAAIETSIGSIDRITRIVKLVVFVASEPGFSGQPVIANGASDALVEIFGEIGQHARSAVGVAVLPLDAPVELELIVEFA